MRIIRGWPVTAITNTVANTVVDQLCGRFREQAAAAADVDKIRWSRPLNKLLQPPAAAADFNVIVVINKR